MGTMAANHDLNFFQNWPPGGQDIGRFRGAEGGLGGVSHESSDAVAVGVGDGNVSNYLKFSLSTIS